MKVWLDAQLPPQLCVWLRAEFGLDAEPVRSLGLRDAKDAAIFAAAREASVTIISKDSDFADLVAKHGPPPQVIWLSCGNSTNRALRAFLAATLRNGLVGSCAWGTNTSGRGLVPPHGASASEMTLAKVWGPSTPGQASTRCATESRSLGI